GAVAPRARRELVSVTPCGRSRRRSRRDLRRRKEEDDLLDELAHRLRTAKWEAATRLTESPSSGSRAAATKTSDAASAINITRRSDSQYRKLCGDSVSRHAAVVRLSRRPRDLMQLVDLSLSGMWSPDCTRFGTASDDLLTHTARPTEEGP